MDSRVRNGPGTGLALFDIKETLTVLNATFEGNGHDRESGGSGVYLEISANSTGYLGFSVRYNFTGCKFIDNKADTGKEKTISGFSRFDKGGGLCCCIRQKAYENIMVTIENSLISGNTAGANGGGTYASFSYDASNGVFLVRRSNYTQNNSTSGGAHFSSFLHNQSLELQPLNCTYLFEDSIFTWNWAVFGGGVSTSATPAKERSNQVYFKDCVWQNNSGQFGSALSILPHAWNIHKEGFMPDFALENCTVDSNYVKDYLDKTESPFVEQYSRGSGALYCNDHTLTFRMCTTFSSNNGSALHAGSCNIRFRSNSETIFSKNAGYFGGAIHVLSSLLLLDNNVKLLFDSNKAYIKGGAIYQNSFHVHMYSYSRTCFFRNTNTTEKIPSRRNILVTFNDNCAGTRCDDTLEYASGHSVYAYSLLPCQRFYKNTASKLTINIFNQVGNFSYTNGRNTEISTDANFTYIWPRTGENNLPIIPGKEVAFPCKDVDDFNQSTTAVYQVTINDCNSSVIVDPAYQYITNNKVILHGNTSSEATIVLSSLTSRFRSLFIRVKMLPCPPGFTQKSCNVNTCKTCCPPGQNYDTCKTCCPSGYTQQSHGINCATCKCSETQYAGIHRCLQSTWRVTATPGCWFGYERNKIESEDTLHTGRCPILFCNNSNLQLPPTADKDKLNEVICAENRMGVLCGKCKEYNSVFYNSLDFQCKSSRSCSLGWLYYILSEILPVTIIFVTIIIFNISFTSGSVNGFIFYSQVVVMLRITAGGMIPFPQALYKIMRFLYLTFSLHPLVLDELSFCPFENASALDVLVLGYISLVYSFFLVIGIVFLVNKLSTRQCWQKYISSKRETLQGGIIHGLSALLVLCYGKCARASILLIGPANIQGKDLQHIKYVVFYNGEILWFSSEHLPYAVPAIIMIVLVVVVPPILLLVYPMHYKVLGFFNVAELRYVQIAFRPLEKLKPFLDSFQGSFKDKFRFFSGLYYFYRLLILIIVTFSKFQEKYFLLSGQLLLMLLIHTISQPYRKEIHNVIDSLLLFNLVIINSITMYNSANVSSDTKRSTIDMISWIQAFLILLPLVAMLLHLLRRGVLRWKRLLSKQKREPEEDTGLSAWFVQEPSRESMYKRMD